jgi:hypothetical protein
MSDVNLGLFLPGTLTSTAGLPARDYWSADAQLNDGTLALLDVGDPSVIFPSGVPAADSYLPNLANVKLWNRLDALGLAYPVADLRLHYVSLAQAADALNSRTSRGGVYSIFSQVTNTNRNRGISISGPGAMNRLISLYPTHQYYSSMWSHVTRAPLEISGAEAPYGGVYGLTGPTANQLGSFQKTHVPPLGASPGFSPNAALSPSHFIGAQLSPPGDALAPTFRALGINGWSGTLPTPDSEVSMSSLLKIWGNLGVWGTTAENKCASEILYRLSLEDLTVAGRTYADRLEEDYAAFNVAFGTGGRFANDIFIPASDFP